METPKTQFLSPQEEMNGENLFKELESELDLGELASDVDSHPDVKKHPLHITAIATDVLFKLLLIASFVFGADVTIRGLESSGYLENLPICSYLSWGLESYDNVACKSYVEIKDAVIHDRTQYENELATTLAILVPKKLQTQNILNSPEVQFIQQRTANRVSLSTAMERLNEIKATATVRRGEDIECRKIALDEKGVISISCDCYGFGLNSGTQETNTSRSTALSFIEKLSDKNSNFQIMEMPKSLDLEKYSSTDLGIKSTFSTHTTLGLKLRFVAPNKS